ncbi:YfhO family protein [Streptococcus iniae]|uniref:Copper ABC transporter permease n=3 Tax=Streptococcus iniae TaxID=1346 RepID=A0A3L8GDU0_STRIN|nr:YfhO family protein [Streptococcus iniae]AHY16789.1 copper ABC transporter permease [Streptococcus iniae]AHY18654.1 copper ABC transporter permease [Streptococcus iniae]AJG26915.1 copper ABC transporter permease [Streptococcus iniae]ASL35842.1 membrane protein [Streptococcus iniae]ATX38780.1 hypothetical protein CTW00_00539 [Streptococcus iniae]
MFNQKKIISLLPYLTSFIIPIIIISFVLYSKDIYYNGPKTILASDGFHQYALFAQNLRNILHGSDSIFYTFTSGLGINFYALISYYLGSFFSPFYYFFSLETIPDAIYVFTIVKFGLIGLTTYFSFHRIYPKVKSYFLIPLSVSFALMSFLTSQFEINNWLDVFILFPIILLGFHGLISQQKTLLYYLSLSLLFVQNYYFAYIFAIFLFCYAVIEIATLKEIKHKIKCFLRFISVSILSALSSSFMLLPTFIDLTSHGEKFTKLSRIFTEQTWYFDLLSKSLIGAYDTTKFNAIPMIYMGLFPLLLSLLFFTIKSIRLSHKIGYLLFISLVIASYYIQPLNLFWQGMHAPNMFLYRYAWSLPLIMLSLSCKVLSREEEISHFSIVMTFIILSLSLTTPYIFLENYHFLSLDLFFLSISFLTAYTILLLANKENNIPILIIIFFTFLFTSLESSLNTFYQVSGIEKEWVFPSRKGYLKNSQDIQTLLKKTSNDSFYRTEQLISQTANDSMKYNYHGISQFSSIRNRSSSQVLDRLGYKSDGTNLNLRYQNNTLIADSLFAVKYNLTHSSHLDKYGFRFISDSGHTKLYQNQNATHLAILTDKPYQDLAFSVNTLDNQTQLLNQLSGQELTYFTEIETELVSKIKPINKRFTVKAEKDSHDSKVSYRVKSPQNSQLYLSLPNISYSNANEKSVLIRVNGKTKEYTTDNAFSLFDLGYYEDATNLDIMLIFPKNMTISYSQPHLYRLNTLNYQKAMTTINKHQVKTKIFKNKVITTYNSPKKASLLITLPFDKGWSASLNGKKVSVQKAQNGFMKVDIPKGKGHLQLSFLPKGLLSGLFISFAGILLYLFIFIIGKRKQEKAPIIKK